MRTSDSVTLSRNGAYYGGYDAKEGVLWVKRTKYRIWFSPEQARIVIAHLDKLGYKGIIMCDWYGIPVK